MKERIIDSTWQQILKYGVKRFTVQDIATDLGISKKTIYAHFDSKEEIIAAVCANLAAADQAAHTEAMEAQTGFFERVDSLINAHSHRRMPLTFRSDLKRYYPEIFARYMSLEFLKDIYHELLAQGLKEGYIRSDIHPLILELVLGKCMEAFDDTQLLTEYDITLQQGLHILRDVLLYGVLAPDRH
ncbi:MAG: TetR/AcrR family transcriptional regulator [Syntrophomonas sp.]